MSLANYKQVVLGAMRDVLAAAGFTKRGQLFSRGVSDVVHLVALQSSRSTTESTLKATVNLAVWVPRLAEHGRSPDIWSAHWRRRLGDVMPGHSDCWWEIPTSCAAEVAASEIGQAIRTYALPEFDAIGSAAALAELWLRGQSPGLTGAQRASFLTAVSDVRSNNALDQARGR